MTFPRELRYTKDHEWARAEGDVATIGITRFAVEQLGDITLVEAPKVGTAVKKGEAMGTIESVKTVSDLYAPVSGTVTAANDALVDAPQKVNDDPYGEGWIVRVKLNDPKELAALMDADAYEKHTATEH
ncbi:MAG: glycine cleavage system protein GcvH [Deltaproteobacteria bacterium]|nr:glycine cleavage system protein GcvH [Deltaproteobacteria bacterium]